jgi:DNA-binding SARP family transcriptional activator
VLLTRAEAFRHLERLTVRPDPHHAEWVTAVRELFPNAVVVTETPALGT